MPFEYRQVEMRALPRAQHLGRPGERAVRRHEHLCDAGRRGTAQHRADVARVLHAVEQQAEIRGALDARHRRRDDGEQADCGQAAGASSAHADSATISVRAGGTRASSARTVGDSTADSATSSDSGGP